MSCDVQLCHRVVDGVCGQQPPHRDDYGSTWTLPQWLDLLDYLTTLFREVVGQNLSDQTVLARLCDAGSGRGEDVLGVLRQRHMEIHRALRDRSHYISSATLQDFDWQLGLALSSDKISSLHTPLLSLSLHMKENGALRSVDVEMNKDELAVLINSLEAANKVVLQLK